MYDLVVIGTDTDSGKTTFSLLWLAAFPDEFRYYKPVESGDSDTAKVRRLVPRARCWDPALRFDEPVAPPLAARGAGRSIPAALDFLVPTLGIGSRFLIETFGGPFSPLNEDELQIELVRAFAGDVVLVSGSHVGAVGRVLATLRAVRDAAVTVRGVALIGRPDPFAVEQIGKYGRLPVASLMPPLTWDADGVAAAAAGQIDELRRFRTAIVTPVRGGPLADWVARDRAAVWHPYTSLRDSADPLPVLAARDEFLTLSDRRQLIDGISSWWTILHGHRHPTLVASLEAASGLIDHVLFAGVTHPFAIEYAEELLKTAPWPGGRVFYSDNGSTAVEVALKMAYQTWCHRGESQRTLFVGFDGAYHGDTFGTMAVGRDPTFFGRFEPLLFRALQVPVEPNQLDDALRKHSGEVTAVIIEPLVQGAGGMRMHSAQTLRDLFEVARRHGVLFIADEVMTGSRTGSFWAHTQAGIAPDLICAAKTLAGGVLPLAVTLASPEIVAAFDTADRTKTFFHGHSFTANPLACAVALANIRMMANGDWLRDSDRISRGWASAVESLKALPGVADVRTCGTILAVEVDAKGGYLAEVGRTMRTVAVANGVLLRPLGSVLYAMPPLCTSDRSLDIILQAMRAAVGEAAR
jgi:adenosylmethionine---8-amino-7-oxononanoate aminotransferase